MATMYSLFLGFLFNVICLPLGNGGSVVGASLPAQGIFFLLDQKEGKNQGCIPLCYSLSKNLSKMELTTFKHHFALNGSCSKELSSQNTRPFYSGIASTPLQDGLMSPVKHFAIEDDLLAYGVKGRKAIIYRNSHFALGQDFQSKGGARGQETLETASVALLSRDEHRVNSLDLCGTFYQGKVPRRSANEDRRNLIITIASAELGTQESTGNNDGPRIEQYLRYTNLGPGYDWCAAFVSWVYGQAGFALPRNPWSPALFPKARSYKDTDKIKPADLFGIYSAKLKRIHHVGLIKEKQGSYIRTIEGNSNDRVESRRRHQRTVYSYAEWVN